MLPWWRASTSRHTTVISHDLASRAGRCSDYPDGRGESDDQRSERRLVQHARDEEPDGGER